MAARRHGSEGPILLLRPRAQQATGWAAPCSRLGHHPLLTRQRYDRCATAGTASASEDWARFRRHLTRLHWHSLAAV